LVLEATTDLLLPPVYLLTRKIRHGRPREESNTQTSTDLSPKLLPLTLDTNLMTNRTNFKTFTSQSKTLCLWSTQLISKSVDGISTILTCSMPARDLTSLSHLLSILSKEILRILSHFHPFSTKTSLLPIKQTESIMSSKVLPENALTRSEKIFKK